MEDEFLNDNGSLQGFQGLRPFSETWVRYIIEYHMPDIGTKEKNEIVSMLKPVVDVAAKGYILRREIPMHLDAYDIIWDKYKMYLKKGKYDPRMLTLQESLRLGFELQLTRSVDASQMRMIFEPKQNIFQRFVNASQKRVGFFKHKKNDNDMDGEM